MCIFFPPGLISPQFGLKYLQIVDTYHISLAFYVIEELYPLAREIQKWAQLVVNWIFHRKLAWKVAEKGGKVTSSCIVVLMGFFGS